MVLKIFCVMGAPGTNATQSVKKLSREHLLMPCTVCYSNPTVWLHIRDDPVAGKSDEHNRRPRPLAALPLKPVVASPYAPPSPPVAAGRSGRRAAADHAGARYPIAAWGCCSRRHPHRRTRIERAASRHSRRRPRVPGAAAAKE